MKLKNIYFFGHNSPNSTEQPVKMFFLKWNSLQWPNFYRVIVLYSTYSLKASQVLSAGTSL